ncbi:hypothetical protein ONE63_005052 [Megalurothrips usitatus]|uniref:Hemocyanin C-terminal domain-containing protein n=1 Tax=Megalurothrips usitatus TaxID=439358 RepID=A0AAV7X4Z5_9NEOP|nr:hypothetical protein ONE63_005052 [Megalurothrips usitatus]
MKHFLSVLPGTNVVHRKSSEASVTIPFERTFRNLDSNRPAAGRALEEFVFCGCGFPHHLLVPRGSREGLTYSLFVMVTDYEQDKVDQVVPGGSCSDAPSICGVFGGKYPDKRPMGFPFDRRPPAHVDTLRSFLTPNMLARSITIRFRYAIESYENNSRKSY